MKTVVRIIAVLEIVGGVFGLGFVIWQLLAAPFTLFTLLLAPVAAGLYVLSFVAGVGLWRGGAFGRKASIVVQAIQTPKVVSPLVTFAFSFGLDLWVHQLWYQEMTNLGFEFRVLAFHQLSVNAPAPIGLGVSVTALVFLALLRRYDPNSISALDVPPPPPPAEWGDDSESRG